MSKMLMLRRTAAKSTATPLHLGDELTSAEESPTETPGLGAEIGHQPQNVSCSGFMVAVG